MNSKSFDPDKFKAAQVKSWDSVAEGWKKWWRTLEQITQSVTDNLVEMADIKPGQNVLDIATGIGEPALTVAQKVGNGGRVTATDQSPQMLSIAQDRAREMGLSNVEFKESDSESLDFPDEHFDAIVCRWGLMFLPDPVTALKSIKRMLKPDAKFSTAVWDKPANIPFFSFAVHTLQEMFNVPPPLPGTPTVAGMADGVVEKRMEQAGFSNIVRKELALNFSFPTAEEYTHLMKDIAAPLSAMMADQPNEEQERYWKTLEENVEKKFGTSNGEVNLISVAICVVGE